MSFQMNDHLDCCVTQFKVLYSNFGAIFNYLLRPQFQLSTVQVCELWNNFSCLQLFAGNDADEFNAVLKQHITPEILITTCRFNSGVFIINYHLFCMNFCSLSFSANFQFVMISCFFSSYNIAWFNNTLSIAYIQRGPAFIDELMQVIPNSQYVKRGTYELKKVWHFTDLFFKFNLFNEAPL
jgi:hypothetical protein